MLRNPSLSRVALAALACLLAFSLSSAADPVPAAASKTMPSLIGATRDDVIALRGKPTGERARGDGLVMIYADGTKVELRAGLVVAVSGSAAGGEIVGADGTRYVPGADGNIKRPVEVNEPGVAAEPATAGSVDTPATGAAPVVADDESEPGGDDDLPPGAEQAIPGGFSTDELEAHVEAMSNPEEDEEEPESLAKTILVLALDAVFRFGFTLLVLRLALHFVGVPFFWPDLFKVSLLYLAVREVMHGLGGLGGWWEFIPLFKLDDVVSFLILACSLTWFKIAGSGLTALKIAAATKAVVVGLMLAVGLAVTFGLSAMQ